MRVTLVPTKFLFNKSRKIFSTPPVEMIKSSYFDELGSDSRLSKKSNWASKSEARILRRPSYSRFTNEWFCNEECRTRNRLISLDSK